MDEISRDLPADTTTPRTPIDRGVGGDAKGPEELLAFERSTVADDLVVRDRRREWPAESAMMPIEPDDEPAGEPAGEPADVTPTPRGDDASTSNDVGQALSGEAAAAAEAAIGETPDAVTVPVDATEAAAAVAAEAETAEIEEDLAAGDDEGLPAVPELADAHAVARMVFVLMLTSREGLTLFRLAQACNTTQKLVEEALGVLRDQLQTLGLPVELARTGDTVKWMSGADTFPYLQRLRGVKKLEKLSPAALETLAVIAYRQPVMRSEIEAIRGVKAGPMLRTLLHHKLVKVTGRSEVPGRPLQYGTTQQFLERFGLSSLQELPSIKEWKSLG